MARKIEVGTVEAHLRNVSSSAETIKSLQDETESLLREYARERARYRTGEITRDVFQNLTREHNRKMEALSRKISTLVGSSTTSLTKLQRLVVSHKPARSRARKTAKRKTTRRKTASRAKRSSRRKSSTRRTSRRKASARRTTRRKARKRRR